MISLPLSAVSEPVAVGSSHSVPRGVKKGDDSDGGHHDSKSYKNWDATVD